jgi:hypothetical protein
VRIEFGIRRHRDTSNWNPQGYSAPRPPVAAAEVVVAAVAGVAAWVYRRRARSAARASTARL